MKLHPPIQIIVLLYTFISAAAWAEKPYQGPPGDLAESQKQGSFAQFCQGQYNATDVPEVNYANALVQAAAKKLDQVDPATFYFYAGQVKAYGLKQQKVFKAPPASAPQGTTAQTHAFLKVLCGEFRDRPTMIAAKLKWYADTKILSNKKRSQTFDYAKDIWDLITAYDYKQFLAVSNEVFSQRETLAARKNQKRIKGFIFANHLMPNPIQPFSICEAKFLIKNYIYDGRKFTQLETHNRAYGGFKKQCPAYDLETFLDFRGDSNFKPNSPESNGMIWTGDAMANRFCNSPTEANPRVSGIRDQDCKDYFTKPFASRWNGARAILGAWLLGDDSAFEVFWDTNQTYNVRPNGKNPRNEPYDYALGSGTASKTLSEKIPNWLAVNNAWALPDLGLNTVALELKNFSGFIYERLSGLVERHTVWEDAGYEDRRGFEKECCASPLVASSYEISLSDEFTQPVLTQDRPPGMVRKNIMFVFKVHKDNWYNTARLSKGEPINFDTMWFDEMSFGRSPRAQHERAWDRLGTALEDELSAVVLLKNITSVLAAKYELEFNDGSKSETKCLAYDGGHIINPAGYLENEEGKFVDINGDTVNENKRVHINDLEKLVSATLDPKVPEGCLDYTDLLMLKSSKLLGI